MTSLRCISASALWIACFLCVSAKEGSPVSSQWDESRIQKLIAEMEDERFSCRENATEELADAHPVVLPSILRLAQNTGDQELTRRIWKPLCRAIADHVGQLGIQFLSNFGLAVADLEIDFAFVVGIEKRPDAGLISLAHFGNVDSPCEGPGLVAFLADDLDPVLGIGAGGDFQLPLVDGVGLRAVVLRPVRPAIEILELPSNRFTQGDMGCPQHHAGNQRGVRRHGDNCRGAHLPTAWCLDAMVWRK